VLPVFGWLVRFQLGSILGVGWCGIAALLVTESGVMSYTFRDHLALGMVGSIMIAGALVPILMRVIAGREVASALTAGFGSGILTFILWELAFDNHVPWQLIAGATAGAWAIVFGIRRYVTGKH